MRRLSLVLALACLAPCLLAQTTNPDLLKMQKSLDDAVATKDWRKIQKLTNANREAVVEMLAKDKLQTGGDFLAAAKVIDDATGWYENRRLQHELTVTAMALGDPEAAAQFTRTWDGLLISMAWGQRFGTLKAEDAKPGDRYFVNPPPLIVLQVFSDIDKARQDAAASKTNAELQKITDDDQGARTNIDFDKITEEQIQAMIKGDIDRRTRVSAILENGDIHTAKDFANASLVFQHGNQVTDYMLAHELSAAALALGDKDSAWLLTATYDRMLLNFGHRQRFGSQWNQDGLSPLDESAMNDRERTTMKQPKLADLKAKAAAQAKKSGG
jgi:hypothetical protein